MVMEERREKKKREKTNAFVGCQANELMARPCASMTELAL